MGFGEGLLTTLGVMFALFLCYAIYKLLPYMKKIMFWIFDFIDACLHSHPIITILIALVLLACIWTFAEGI